MEGGWGTCMYNPSILPLYTSTWLGDVGNMTIVIQPRPSYLEEGHNKYFGSGFWPLDMSFPAIQSLKIIRQVSCHCETTFSWRWMATFHSRTTVQHVEEKKGEGGGSPTNQPPPPSSCGSVAPGQKKFGWGSSIRIYSDQGLQTCSLPPSAEKSFSVLCNFFLRRFRSPPPLTYIRHQEHHNRWKLY